VADADVGVGIVGSGDMGGVYAEAAARHVTGARLVAIQGGRRAPALAADYGADHEETLDGLLARRDVDAVIVATPHALHVGQVQAVVGAGKHVLVEKPMALDTAECDAMIAAARSAGVDLSVILTMRFDTNFRAAKARLDAGEIGEPRMLRISGLTPGYDMGHKTWIGDRENGGALLDWGSHGFDILRFVAGSDPIRLTAELADFGVAPVGEPSAMVQIRYANGVMAQLWMSYELPTPGLDSPFRLWIVGEKGILAVNRFGQTMLGHGGRWEVISEEPLPDWEKERRHDPVRVIAPARQIQDWVDALRGGRPSSAPADAGRWAVMQVEAAYRSWQSGSTVALPLAAPVAAGVA
jgi:myo-inositol 2-dehydrogenase/D-chiro-inositol 1-dehydrogenase